MSRTGLALAATLAAATLAALPAAADPVVVEGPGVCNQRSITLQEGQVLEERTLYLRGSAPVGPVDGWQDALTGGNRLSMSPEVPTSPTDKVYPIHLTGVAGNPDAHANPLLGYWWYNLPAAEQIVCAALSIHGASTDGQLGMQMWIDGDLASSTAPDAQTIASAPANSLETYTGNFGKIDLRPSSHFVVQLDAATPGGLALYDSAAHASRFDYVVVVAAEG